MLTSELSPSAWIFFPLSLPSSLRPLVPPRVCPVLFRSVAYLETWQAEQRRQLLCGVDGGKDKESSTAHIWVPWVQRQRQQLCYKNRFAIRDSQQRESQLCWQQGLKQPFFFLGGKTAAFWTAYAAPWRGSPGPTHWLEGGDVNERPGQAPNTMSLWEGHSSNWAVQGFFFFFSFSFSFSFFFSPSFFFFLLLSLSFYFFFSFSLRWGKRHPGDRKLICKISEFC